MAQQSARRGRKNQVYSSCLEHAFMIWSPVCELPYGPRSFIAATSEAGQMAASDYVPNFFKNRLHLAGRPQMSTRPSTTLAHFARDGFPNKFFSDSWVVGFWRGRPWVARYRIGETNS